MNVIPYNKRTYDQMATRRGKKNKPNQTQFPAATHPCSGPSHRMSKIPAPPPKRVGGIEPP